MSADVQEKVLFLYLMVGIGLTITPVGTPLCSVGHPVIRPLL